MDYVTSFLTCDIWNGNAVIADCVYLHALCPGFYFLFKKYQAESQSDFATVGDTVMMLFEMTLGEYKVSCPYQLVSLS